MNQLGESMNDNLFLLLMIIYWWWWFNFDKNLFETHKSDSQVNFNFFHLTSYSLSSNPPISLLLLLRICLDDYAVRFAYFKNQWCLSLSANIEDKTKCLNSSLSYWADPSTDDFITLEITQKQTHNLHLNFKCKINNCLQFAHKQVDECRLLAAGRWHGVNALVHLTEYRWILDHRSARSSSCNLIK